MKYIIYILILVTFAFSQDVYRLNESTFVYPCIGDSTGMLNFVGLPLESDYVNASDFDPDGDNINSISVFNAAEQAWLTAGYHPALGWGTDFEVETGSAYMINAVNDFDFTLTGDSADVTYDLVTTPYYDMNHIVHPLSKSHLDSLSEIGDDIGVDYCNTVNYWNNLTQTWTGTSYNTLFGMWMGDYNSQPGKPLSVIMTDNLTWPTLEKNENYDNFTKDNKDILKAVSGGPRVVYFHIQDYYGNEFNFPEEEHLIKSFEVWITGFEEYVLSPSDYGCGFATINGLSVAYINLASFINDWQPYQELNFLIQDRDFTPYDSYIEFNIDASNSPIYVGFEPLISGSGEPERLDPGLYNGGLISLNVNNLQLITQSDSLILSWDDASNNFTFPPYLFQGYKIYESDNPYGELTPITTIYNETWQTDIIDNKKFYKVKYQFSKFDTKSKTGKIK